MALDIPCKYKVIYYDSFGECIGFEWFNKKKHAKESMLQNVGHSVLYDDNGNVIFSNEIKRVR